MPNFLRFGAPAFLLALALAGPARGGEAHYLLMFGAQRIPNNPNYAHSWAAFVKASWDGDGPPTGPARLEAHMISWLPADGVIRSFTLRAEPGRNYGLHETFDFVLGHGERVSLWGPYPIHPELYRRALERISELDSGRIRYKAFDTGRIVGRVVNCFHAMSSLAGWPTLRVASIAYGEVASYAVLLRFQRRAWILDERPQYWVSSALGLDRYPIIYRGGVNPPRSGALYGPVYRALGGERNLRATFGPPG